MDRPIIFSAPMVLALLAGRKTQTRRLATSPLRRCGVGDQLWVRENFALVGGGDPGLVITRADYPSCVPSHYENVPESAAEIRWTPSIHMPRWASRLTLIVEAVRVEPLQAITDADALAEGVEYETADPPFYYVPYIHPHSLTGVETSEGARGSFAKLWRHLHGPESWDANPMVVALTFRVVAANIDRVPEAAHV